MTVTGGVVSWIIGGLLVVAVIVVTISSLVKRRK